MINVKHVKLLLATIILGICIFQMKDAYTKYYETKQGDTSFNVANWSILLNDIDISSGAELSSLVNPVYTNNNNIESGVIAPTSEGYFDLEINAENTQVSFQYTISIAPSSNTEVTDLRISGYQIDGGTLIPVQNGINNLSNTVAYNAQDKTIELRIYFQWYEGEGESMDNESDTYASIHGGTGKINVSASFTQLAS